MGVFSNLIFALRPCFFKCCNNATINSSQVPKWFPKLKSLRRKYFRDRDSLPGANLEDGDAPGCQKATEAATDLAIGIEAIGAAQ